MPASRPFAPDLPALPLLALILASSCAPPETGPLTATAPLHLEEHLDVARIVGSEVPEEVPAAVEWRFAEPQPQWRTVGFPASEGEPITMTPLADALRLTLTETTRHLGLATGAVGVELPDWRPEDWASAVVEARTADPVETLAVEFNRRRERGRTYVGGYTPFAQHGGSVKPVADGAVHSYLIPLGARGRSLADWTELGIVVTARESATVDLVSVRMIPNQAAFAGAPVGVRSEGRQDVYRRALYAHPPGRIEYRVRVPEGGRLDFGLGVVGEEAVTFRVIAGDGKGDETLFEESYDDPTRWAQHTVDLAARAGQTITLTLAADGEGARSVALWAAPTLSGTHPGKRPNVILYVIDGGGAEMTSLYGYNRRTTPHLEVSSEQLDALRALGYLQ